jgi:two-component system response regulator (stage 0 sporulation protein F)
VTEKKVVLVVDDDEPIRRLLKVVFELDGVEVIEATDGEEAIAVTEAQKPAVIVLDVMMPGFDGLEVLRRLRAADRESKIVMLTAKDDPDILAAAEEAGAAAYLTKPFSADALQEIVDRLLR